jgi:hypothetical protein
MVVRQARSAQPLAYAAFGLGFVAIDPHSGRTLAVGELTDGGQKMIELLFSG